MALTYRHYARIIISLFYNAAGKFVIGYMPLGGEKEYYLACACQELYVPPGAYITLRGLKVQAQFVGG